MPPAFHNSLPARYAEIRVDADIALIDFAIVSNMANDAHGPILGEAELLRRSAYPRDVNSP
jgi:hypothetical protein